MTQFHAITVIDGLAFPEGPRWHAGRLWFTDQHARTINAVSPDGRHEIIAETDDLPGGLGWLPDGTLLVVYMTERRLMRWTGEGLTTHADLSALASFHCNDMVVDDAGRAYVGNFGFDLHGGAARRSAELILVEPDGRASVIADDLIFPNGSVITPDRCSLLVAETFAHRIRTFELGPEGRLHSNEPWAELGDATPDGICLDADGALWIASPGTGDVLHVQRGGARIDSCVTLGTPYACMLGDEDRKTLYVCTAETDDPADAAARRSGRIERTRVSRPGAGLP
jgi:sugar lactone lactonase YvrE